MLQPKVEIATATAGEGVGAALNGAHPEVAGARSDLAVIGREEDSKSRGGGGGGSDEFGSGGASGGGIRWPRQETLALLQIRSDMDGVFRDSRHKGPLWDDISRKMAEMGYRRSAKKCREKFENVYKYHRRTKDGRSGKADGKTYRFFDQLEALESNHSFSMSSFLPPPEAAVPIAMAIPPPRLPPSLTATQPPFTVTSIAPQVQPVESPVIHHIQPTSAHPAPAPVQNAKYNNPMNFPNSPSGTPSSSSSSTSSDDEIMRTRSRRKGKWKDLFQKLTKDVMRKQDELERKFLDAMERRENERKVREESWKAREMARLKHEHEILVQERSMLSAKEAALFSFLQKLSDNQQIPLPSAILQPQPPPPPTTPTFRSPIPVPILPIQQDTIIMNPVASPAPATAQMHRDNGDRSSSRWPKEEIEALIKLRTKMEHKYQEGVPKGPLWEEISSAMRSLGYNRNAKRCKEKWENINKYYRKVKESNKKRRVDSKTCPYYYLLEALYADKTIMSPAAVTAEPPQQQDDGDEHDDDDEDEEGGYEMAGNTNSSSGGSSVGGATAAMEKES